MFFSNPFSIPLKFTQLDQAFPDQTPLDSLSPRSSDRYQAPLKKASPFFVHGPAALSAPCPCSLFSLSLSSIFSLSILSLSRCAHLTRVRTGCLQTTKPKYSSIFYNTYLYRYYCIVCCYNFRFVLACICVRFYGSVRVVDYWAWFQDRCSAAWICRLQNVLCLKRADVNQKLRCYLRSDCFYKFWFVLAPIIR